MKKLLIIFILLSTGCYSFKPVSTIDNFHLYQGYLEVQYELSQKEEEYNNLFSSYLSLDPSLVPSYKPPVKSYKVTGERSDMGSSGFAKYELTPVYDYSSSNAQALKNISAGVDKKKAEKEIKRLKARLSELEFELSKRGHMP